MSNPTLNVLNFLSIESFLENKIYETQAINFVHGDLIQCYYQLVEGMGWEQIYASLVEASNITLENQSILEAAKKHLNAVRQTKEYASLLN